MNNGNKITKNMPLSLGTPDTLLTHDTGHAVSLNLASESQRSQQSKNIAVTSLDSNPLSTDNESPLHTVTLSEFKDKAELRRLQYSSEDFLEIIQFLKHNILPKDAKKAQAIVNDSDNWCLLDDILHHIYIPQRRNIKSVKPTILQIAVPESLRKKIMEACHDKNGHWAIEKCYPTVLNHFYWKGLYSSLRNYVENCLLCSRASQKLPKVSPAQHMPLLGIFEQVVVDHIKMPAAIAPVIGQTVSYILTLIDRLSQWTQLISVPDCTAKTAALAIQQHWIPNYGIMKSLHSDLGSAWTSNLF